MGLADILDDKISITDSLIDLAYLALDTTEAVVDTRRIAKVIKIYSVLLSM